jgi:hypothetical protein
MAIDGDYFVIARDPYQPIEQGAVIVRGAAQCAAVRKLLDYMLSAPAQAQLAKSGLTLARWNGKKTDQPGSVSRRRRVFPLSRRSCPPSGFVCGP